MCVVAGSGCPEGCLADVRHPPCSFAWLLFWNRSCHEQLDVLGPGVTVYLEPVSFRFLKVSFFKCISLYNLHSHFDVKMFFMLKFLKSRFQHRFLPSFMTRSQGVFT